MIICIHLLCVVKIWALFLVLITFQNAAVQTGKVLIHVEGANLKLGGHIHAAIFDKKNFPKTGKHLLGMSKEIKEANTLINFEEVPVGQYAIALFQDEDGNNKLNTNFIGYPTEPVGFSNNAKIRFGPPSFEEAKIIVTQGQTLNLVIHLH